LSDRGFRRVSYLKLLKEQEGHSFLVRIAENLTVESKKCKRLLKKCGLQPGHALDLLYCCDVLTCERFLDEVGETVIVVTPVFSICPETLAVRPPVEATSATIKADPMIIPSMVRALRTLRSFKALKAILYTSKFAAVNSPYPVVDPKKN
jgi:hypothetical protein